MINDVLFKTFMNKIYEKMKHILIFFNDYWSFQCKFKKKRTPRKTRFKKVLYKSKFSYD